MPGSQTPFRLQREVINPLDDGCELVEAVLHWSAGQHQTVRRVQAFHGECGLGRPVLDTLGFVQHHDVGRPVVNGVDIANQLLVVPQEKPATAPRERGAALSGSAVDDGGGRVSKELPLPKPLRLERGGNDEQATADAARVPEGMTGSNRLRGLPSPMSSARSSRPRTKNRSTPSR